MKNQSIRLILCLGFCLAACCQVYARTSRSPRLTRKEKLARDLREYYVKLDQRLFGEKDFKKVERLLRKAEKDEMHRPLVVALLAQYQARMERQPSEGIKLLAPEVLGEDKAKEWLGKLEDAETKRDRKYNDAVRQAYFDRKPKPEKPTNLALAFPFQQIQVSDLNIDCVLEVARCLMAMNDVQTALRIIDKVGSRFEGDGRVLAFECLGDVRVKLSMLSEAMKDYKNALGLLKKITPTEGLDHWQKRVQARIQRKIKELQQLLEIQKWGPGFVLYRAAETKRRKNKDYGEAILLYDQLIEKFPKSVWEQAGKCYRIKCRLELAKSKERPKSLRQAIAARQKKVDEEEQFIRLAKKYKVPKATIEEFEAGKAKLEAKVKELQDIPVGKKSLELAKEEARACIKDGLFNLYNGEILVAIGEYSFNQELDPEQADKYFRQAWAWLSKVEGVDTSVKTYSIPAKAAKVAAANQVAVKKDFWGNIERQGQRIGSVVNRRTCKWYLNDLRAKTVMAIGFLCFYQEKNEEAVNWYKKALAYDEKTKKLAAAGKWNDYKRLNWGAEHGYLYAYPDELKNFRRQQRFVILMGDFYFCTERFAASEALCDRMLKGEFGKLTGRQRDYCHLLKADCTYWQRDRKGALAEFMKVLEKREGGYTEIRAQYAAGMVASQMGPEMEKKALNLWYGLAKTRKKDEYVYKAMINAAIILNKHGRNAEAVSILGRVPDDDIGYGKLAAHIRKEFQEQ